MRYSAAGERGRRLRGDPKGLLIAAVAASSAGLLGTNTLPLIVGALIDGLGLEPARAGALGSAELGAVALASLALAPRMAQLSRRTLALAGVLGVTVGYLASSFAGGFGSLLAARLVAGLGAGAALAAVNATLAGSDDPDALYARLTVLGGLVAACVLAALPFALGPWGHRGGFAALAAFALVCLPVTRRLPARAGGAAPSLAPLPNRGLAALALLGLLLEASLNNALWSFSERIGLGAGTPPEAVGAVLGGATLAGLAGAGLAAALSTRLGRALPLVSGVAAATAARGAITQVETPVAFAALQVAWASAYLFTLPYVLGTLAALDRQGRWSAAAIAAITIGSAIGPGVAGGVVESAGVEGLGLVVVVGGSVVLALLGSVGRAIDRRGIGGPLD